MKSEALIRCEQLIPQDLPFDYQGNALDFELHKGKIISLVGPDYSGKGNWIRAICGLEQQSSGSITINGSNTEDLTAEQWKMIRMKVAYLHQDTALLSAANGLANTLIPALYHQLDRETDKLQLATQARELLRQIDEDIDLYELPAYISKEHCYKIATARALLLKPDVLALNNPFAHFNYHSKFHFKAFLESRVKQGLSLLMLTQDIPYAIEISDKIIFASRQGLHYFDSKEAIRDCDIPEVVKFFNRPQNQIKL